MLGGVQVFELDLRVQQAGHFVKARKLLVPSCGSGLFEVGQQGAVSGAAGEFTNEVGINPGDKELKQLEHVSLFAQKQVFT